MIAQEERQAPVGAVTEAADFDQLPIVIGVTGHRKIDPAAEPALREAFAGILDRFSAQYPSTPLLVVSGLAAGADMLAAEVALERKIRVLAAFPMPSEAYEKSFSPEELLRFRDIRSHCWKEAVVGTGDTPEKNYVALGAFLAYYSSVLVAFWDQVDGRGAGGTADVIHLRETGEGPIPPASIIHYAPDVGPIFDIATPRDAQQQLAVAPGTVNERYPERPYLDLVPRKPRKKTPQPDAKLKFDHTLCNLDRFNADIALEMAPPDLTTLERLQRRTDEVAKRFQDWTLVTLRTLYILAAIAGAVQIALIYPVPINSGLTTALRLGVLGIAFAGFRFAKRLDFENRYQDYRSIAEGLRVQLAWCCAGLHDRLAEASYLQMQQSELQWIRLVLRTAYLVSGARVLTQTALPAAATYTQEWLDGQLKYYETSARREERNQRLASQRSTILTSVSGAIVAIAILLSFAVAGVGPVKIHTHVLGVRVDREFAQWSLYKQLPGLERMQWHGIRFNQAGVKRWLTWGSAVPAALAGMLVLLLQFYTQQRGYMENARRYQHMYSVFYAAKRRLETDPDNALTVLGELGHEALAEHASWLILHRERPLHFVAT